MRDLRDPMFWLDESRVVNFCYSTTEPSVGLALNKVNSKVKLYMADTGLLVSLAFSSGDLEQGGLYAKILRGKLEFNKGMLVENLVAQLLRSAGHPLYFFSQYSKEDAEDRMEIDFLIRKGNITSRHNIIAIEVKSSTRYTLTSIEKFQRKFGKWLEQPIIFHSADLELKEGKLYLPLYMAGLV